VPGRFAAAARAPPARYAPIVEHRPPTLEWPAAGPPSTTVAAPLGGDPLGPWAGPAAAPAPREDAAGDGKTDLSGGAAGGDDGPGATFDRDGLTVYSVEMRRLAVWEWREGGASTAGAGRVLVATPQALLHHFLFESFVARDAAARATFARFYAATLAVIRAGADAAARADVVAAQTPAVSADTSPFGLPVRPLGDRHLGEAYAARMTAAFGAADPGVLETLGLRYGPAEAAALLQMPGTFRPAKGGPRPRFDPERNPHFARDGRRLIKD
jgi:hypothetical protein